MISKSVSSGVKSSVENILNESIVTVLQLVLKLKGMLGAAGGGVL